MTPSLIPHSRNELLRKQELETQVLRFMDFPREIRDLVYDQIWRQKPIMVRPAKGFAKVKIRYSDPNDDSSNWLKIESEHHQWLFGSKSLLAEAIQQLNLKAEWTVLIVGSWDRLDRRAYHSNVRRWCFPLIDLHGATNITLSYCEFSSSLVRERVLTPDFTTTSVIREIMQLCQTRGKAVLKKVRLIFRRLGRTVREHYDWDKGRLDLSLLTSMGFPPLDQLETKLEKVSVSSRLEQGWARMHREEMARVGPMLVANGILEEHGSEIRYMKRKQLVG